MLRSAQVLSFVAIAAVVVFGMAGNASAIIVEQDESGSNFSGPGWTGGDALTGTMEPAAGNDRYLTAWAAGSP